MWLLPLIFLFLASISEVKGSRKCSEDRLYQLINGLLRTVNYMDDHQTEFNLDAHLCLHMTADQMSVLAENLFKKHFAGKDDLLFRLAHISNLTNDVANQSIPFVQADDPEYYEPLIGMFDKGYWRVYYPQRDINKSLQQNPLACSHSNVTEFLEMSDKCLAQIARHSPSQSTKCNISMGCLKNMTEDGYRDYQLTHELIYLQTAEMHGCLPTLTEMGYNLSHVISLQNLFCANALRDAEEITRSGYPTSHRDVLLEEIGICGMYGFKDFWREDWIDRILAWQMKSGCYSVFGYDLYVCQDELRSSSNIRRTRRNEKIMEGSCSSHLTGVAMIAMAANIRFCAEAFAEVT